jgi:hypothetical protein
MRGASQLESDVCDAYGEAPVVVQMIVMYGGSHARPTAWLECPSGRASTGYQVPSTHCV